MKYTLILITSVLIGILVGKIVAFQIPDDVITVLLILLVFVVGIDIGSDRKIIQKIKKNIKISIFQSLLTAAGTMIFGGFVSFFTDLNFLEAMGAVSGYGWYSLSGVMISNLYSPFLGAVAFSSNVIRELFAIILIPMYSKVSALGAISMGGAATMDTLLGIVSKSVKDKKYVLIGFGQGLILSILVPLVITFIFKFLLR